MDLENKLIKMYEVIDDKYKKSFYFALAITVSCFSIYIFHYLFNNHCDRFFSISYKDQLMHGRWFSVFWFFLMGFSETPVLIPLLTSLFNVVTIFILISLWQKTLIKKSLSTIQLMVCSLFFSISPFLLEIFYFSWATLLYSGGMLISAVSMFVISNPEWKRFTFFRFFISALLVVFSLASYQPVLSFLSTILFIQIFLLLLNKHESDVSFKEFISKITIPSSVVLIGLIGYKLSLKISLFKPKPSYRNDLIESSQVFERIYEVFNSAIRSLVISQPGFPTYIKYLILLILSISFLGVIWNFSNRSFRRFIFIYVPSMIIAFLLIIASTKTLFFVSSFSKFYIYRMNLGYGVLYTFIFYLFFIYIKIPTIKSVGILISFIVLFHFYQSNLLRQGLLLRGQLHDLSVANRVLSRIEELDLAKNKKYDIVKVGSYSKYRKKILKRAFGEFDFHSSANLDYGEISASWCPGSVFYTLGTDLNLNYGFLKRFKDKIAKAREIIKKENRKPWPHKSSVFIHNNFIVVYFK